jgi:hypothetical protein
VYARLTVATLSGLEDSLYKSTDRAATWTQLTALSAYNLVTCDNTGTFVSVTGGPTTTCYFSINGGSNFKELTPSLTASAIAMSGDGNYLVAVQTNSAISVGRARLV